MLIDTDMWPLTLTLVWNRIDTDLWLMTEAGEGRGPRDGWGRERMEASGTQQQQPGQGAWGSWDSREVVGSFSVYHWSVSSIWRVYHQRGAGRANTCHANET